VLVILNGETFVSPLIQMPASNLLVSCQPAAYVRVGQPHHKPCQLAVRLRPKKQVPVVGHDAESQHLYRDDLLRFYQAAMKRGVVLLRAKELGFPHAPIEDVVNDSTGSQSSSARHPRYPTGPRRKIQNRRLSLFVFSEQQNGQRDLCEMPCMRVCGPSRHRRQIRAVY
jgi:hypothetical protein